VVITETAAAPAAATLPRVRPLLGNGFDPERIYARRSPGVVTIFSEFGSGEAAQGSGFVVSSDGYVLTSSHVITDASVRPAGAKPRVAGRVFVEFADRDRVPAKVVGFDVFDDVGLLHVSPRLHALSPVPLGDSSASFEARLSSSLGFALELPRPGLAPGRSGSNGALPMRWRRPSSISLAVMG